MIGEALHLPTKYFKKSLAVVDMKNDWEVIYPIKLK